MAIIKKIKIKNALMGKFLGCEHCDNGTKLLYKSYTNLSEIVACEHCGLKVRVNFVRKHHDEDNAGEAKYVNLNAMSKQELEKMLESFAYDLVNFSLRAENGEIFVPKKGLKRLIKEYVTPTKVK